MKVRLRAKGTCLLHRRSAQDGHRNPWDVLPPGALQHRRPLTASSFTVPAFASTPKSSVLAQIRVDRAWLTRQFPQTIRATSSKTLLHDSRKTALNLLHEVLRAHGADVGQAGSDRTKVPLDGRKQNLGKSLAVSTPRIPIFLLPWIGF